jgi:hypothetical protein
MTWGDKRPLVVELVLELELRCNIHALQHPQRRLFLGARTGSAAVEEHGGLAGGGRAYRPCAIWTKLTEPRASQ